MCGCTHANFLGGLKREKSLWNSMSGRAVHWLHAAYFRPGGVHQDLPKNLSEDIFDWAENFPDKLDDLEGLLTENRIFKQRNVDIGIVSKKEAIELGFSGVMLRGSGVPWDLRRSQPYETYSDYKFAIPIGKNGDYYDRYLLRIGRNERKYKHYQASTQKIREYDW